MKHLKTYENIIPRWLKRQPEEPDEFKIGDKVYCINNKGLENTLEIGKEYTIAFCSQKLYNVIRLDEIEGLLARQDMSSGQIRFTKDPNHPILIQLSANKYNL